MLAILSLSFLTTSAYAAILIGVYGSIYTRFYYEIVPVKPEPQEGSYTCAS